MAEIVPWSAKGTNNNCRLKPFQVIARCHFSKPIKQGTFQNLLFIV